MQFSGGRSSPTPPGRSTANCDAGDHRVAYFDRLPTELNLEIAEKLELRDLNALARTSRALNEILTTYMYRRAKNLGKEFGGNPFFLDAVERGNVAAVKHFIAVGARVNMQADHEDGTALHRCSLNGHREVAQVLIDNGADVLAWNSFVGSPLHSVIVGQEPNEAILRLLVDAGADIMATHKFFGPVLYAAARIGNDAMVQHLINRGASAERSRQYGRTALHATASRGSAATIRYLLGAGLDIEARDADGQTPLQNAVGAGKTECVEALLQAGANVMATDNFGNTVLCVAVTQKGTDAIAHRIRHLGSPRAAPEGNAQAAGAECFPLCRFAKSKNRIIEMLLDAGADIRATNVWGYGPLDWAQHRVGSN
jgi:ankyrin repeat protein